MVQLQTTADFESEQAEGKAAAVAKTEEPTIFDPLSETYIPVSDLDTLMDCNETLKRMASDIRAARDHIERALGQKVGTPGLNEPRTKRVKTKSGRTIKVEFAGPSWQQDLLREAFHAYPQFRDDYLAIEKIRVKAREVKKLRQTFGEVDFDTFKTMVLDAEKDPPEKPKSITLEK